MDDQVYVQVFFLDNSYKTFLVPRAIKASDLTTIIADKLGFQNVEENAYWFGLYESFTGMVSHIYCVMMWKHICCCSYLLTLEGAER